MVAVTVAWYDRRREAVCTPLRGGEPLSARHGPRRRELVTVFQSSAATVIHRPIGEVFRFATDLSNIPLWVSTGQIALHGPIWRRDAV